MQRLLFVLAGIAFSCTFLHAADPTPQTGFRFGFASERPLKLPLNADLGQAGLTTIDSENLWTTGVGMGFRFGTVSWDLTTSRFTNALFAGPTGSTRTKLVGDETTLTAGGQWKLPAQTFLMAGVGAGVTKAQLQTYGAKVSTWSEALANTHQVTLVSSWNWEAVGSLRLGWKPFNPDKPSLMLSVGVSAAWQPFPMVWKLNDDVPLSGLGALWTTRWTPSLWMGIE